MYLFFPLRIENNKNKDNDEFETRVLGNQYDIQLEPIFPHFVALQFWLPTEEKTPIDHPVFSK